MSSIFHINPPHENMEIILIFKIFPISEEIYIYIYINKRYTHKIELLLTQSSVSSDTEDIIKTKNFGI